MKYSVMIIQLFVLIELTLGLSGNILADPALINSVDVKLKLQLTLTSALRSGETFKLGPFSDGSIMTTSSKNHKGHLDRCNIEAPASGVKITHCLFENN